MESALRCVEDSANHACVADLKVPRRAAIEGSELGSNVGDGPPIFGTIGAVEGHDDLRFVVAFARRADVEAPGDFENVARRFRGASGRSLAAVSDHLGTDN